MCVSRVLPTGDVGGQKCGRKSRPRSHRGRSFRSVDTSISIRVAHGRDLQHATSSPEERPRSASSWICGDQGHRVSDEIKHPPSAPIGEAASLFYLLGGMAAKHLLIVGGLVPPLLIPKAADPHIGSADIDLCLSLAITSGTTREYYRSIEETIEPYFEPEHTSGFRWRKKDSAPDLPLILDFLAPAAEDDTLLAGGTHALDEKTATQNAGPRLRPLPVRAGRLIDEDAMSKYPRRRTAHLSPWSASRRANPPCRPGRIPRRQGPRAHRSRRPQGRLRRVLVVP
jgi:hypothetical protein